MDAPATAASIPVLAQHHGAIGALRPKGVITQNSLPSVVSALAELHLGGRPMLVIDLAETVVLDGAALEWLLDTDDQFGSLGGGVSIANSNDLCDEIFRLTGLTDRLAIYSDLATALGSFAK